MAVSLNKLSECSKACFPLKWKGVNKLDKHLVMGSWTSQWGISEEQSIFPRSERIGRTKVAIYPSSYGGLSKKEIWVQ